MPATTSPALSRGINLTNWFRFPVSRDPAALAGYITDQALADLRAAGFDFVRLAVDPDLVEAQLPVPDRRPPPHSATGADGDRVAASARLGSGNQTGDRDRLRRFWHNLAPALRLLDPARDRAGSAERAGVSC